MAVERPANLLEESGLPIFYAIQPDLTTIPSPPDAEEFDLSARTTVQSLTLMQKSAIVATSGSTIAWRLSSDEGPYLNGHDFAPAPLAIMTAGFTADLMEWVKRALVAAPIPTRNLSLTLDTRFTIEGSMLKRTMVAGAENPEIEVACDVSDREASTNAVLAGIKASATTGLFTSQLTGLFSLTSHGRRIPVEHGAEMNDNVLPRPPWHWNVPNSGPEQLRSVCVQSRKR